MKNRILFFGVEGVWRDDRSSSERYNDPPEEVMNHVDRTKIDMMLNVVKELNLKMVLCDKWRRDNLQQAVRKLVRPLSLYGVTVEAHDRPSPGEQIAHWLKENEAYVSDYAVLTSKQLWTHPEVQERQVMVRWQYGLREKDIEQLRKMYVREG